MDEDNIRKIARLGGVELNETLRQKIEDAKQESDLEERLDEVLNRAMKGAINLGSELNKMGDQVTQRAVTVAILEAEEEAQEKGEKQGLPANELRQFVAAQVAGDAKAIQKRVKEVADLLNKLILRKLPSEVAKQTKEFQKTIR